MNTQVCNIIKLSPLFIIMVFSGCNPKKVPEIIKDTEHIVEETVDLITTQTDAKTETAKCVDLAGDIIEEVGDVV